jgi:hypothetical protein
VEKIYYCSSTSGLKVVTPQSKKSENLEIIGFRSKIACILNFIERNNRFKFSIGKDLKSGLCFVCERYEGSIHSALKEEKVSIYELEQVLFDKSEIYWSDKLAISASCEVIHEEIIEDIYEYLTEQSRQGLLIICGYPKRINGIPVDDQDLVDYAVLQYRMYGESVVATIEQLHPQLLDRVKQGIDSGLYKEYGI